jgi:hypothetical protein
MATFSKRILSGSTDGKAIKVVQTATAGTTIHTAVQARVILMRFGCMRSTVLLRQLN